MQFNKFLKWASSSLVGHMVLIGVPCWVAGFLSLSLANYFEGTLTITWALGTLVESAVAGAAVATLVWYTMTLPRIKEIARIKNKQ